MPLIVNIVILLSACLAYAQAPPQRPLPKDERAKDSYSLGYEFGSDLRLRGVEVDTDVLLSAVRAAIEGREPLLSSTEMRNTLNELTKKVAVMQELRFRDYAAKNLIQSKEFMNANQSKEGVKTLPGGLQFKVIGEGNGPKPKPNDIVKVSYRGTLTDGTEVDSFDRPVIARVDDLARGLSKAVPLMSVGSKWQLFVPPALGYGERGFRRIPPNSVLVYELELVSIENTLPTEAVPHAAAQNSGAQ